MKEKNDMRRDDLWLTADAAAALLELTQSIQTNRDLDDDPLNESAILTAARILTEQVARKLDIEACQVKRVSQ